MRASQKYAILLVLLLCLSSLNVIIVRGNPQKERTSIDIGRIYESINLNPFRNIQTLSKDEKVTFFDDFEEYANGTFPSQNWILVFDGRGSSYQVITDIVSYSGNKSFQLWGRPRWSAVVMHKFNSNATLIGCEEAILISEQNENPEGTPHDRACVFWNREIDQWGKGWTEVKFYHTDLTMRVQNGSNEIIIGTWEPGKWYKVRLLLNREINKYKVWINGNYVGEF